MASSIREGTRIRASLVLVILGTLLEIACLYNLVPGTFMVFALVAAPLVAAGIFVFLITVWQIMARTGSV